MAFVSNYYSLSVVGEVTRTKKVIQSNITEDNGQPWSIEV